jgi:hypothetical protein
MHTRVNRRRMAAASAVIAGALVGPGVIAASAGAATGPTATLSSGTVTISGTPARDVINVTAGADQLAIDLNSDGTIDARFRMSEVQRVNVLAGDGDDGVSVSGAGVGDVPITINGGLGNDGGGVVGNIGDSGAGDALVSINGGGGNDDFVVAVPGPATVNAGAGDDVIDGGGAGIGKETILLGDGNDKLVSSLSAFVGARNDIVNGGGGKDTMELDGSFASEGINLSAHAGHLIVDHQLRDHVDADNVENVSWFGFGGLDGGDSVSVGDLSGTDVVNFTPDFSDPRDPTRANNSDDQLTVAGTAGDDHVSVSNLGPSITVSGLTPVVTPVQLDSRDVLRIDTLGGNDTVDSSGLQRGLVQLQVSSARS